YGIRLLRLLELIFQLPLRREAVRKLGVWVEIHQLIRFIQTAGKRDQARRQRVDHHAHMMTGLISHIGIIVNYKPAIGIYLDILDRISDRDPQVCDLKLRSREMDQHDRSRIRPMKLLALTIELLQNTAGQDLVDIPLIIRINDDHFIAADSEYRPLGIPQNNADPMENFIAIFMAPFLIQRFEVI